MSYQPSEDIRMQIKEVRKANGDDAPELDALYEELDEAMGNEDLEMYGNDFTRLLKRVMKS